MEAAFPAARRTDRRHAHGYALGRDRLDPLLVDRARLAGAMVWQPARVRAVDGVAGDHVVEVERGGTTRALRAAVVIDAHGSWERGPADAAGDAPARRPPGADDLFGFKAVFRGAALEPGCLPVLAYPGGYGGIVLGDDGRVTLAGCLRREALRALRARTGLAAGPAFEAHVRAACRGAREALVGATRDGAWLAVGPLRPGARVHEPVEVFPVGNAAGECHPIVGEGIAMALQSAMLLAARLAPLRPGALDRDALARARRAYAADWREQFTRRLHVARACAHLAARPALAHAATHLLARHPPLLTGVARLAGKTAPFHLPSSRGHA